MNSPEDFPGYLSVKDTKKWFLKPETFTCPSGYITGITVNWGKVNIIRPECIIYDKEIEIPQDAMVKLTLQNYMKQACIK